MNLQFLEPLKKVPQSDVDQGNFVYILDKTHFKPCCFGAHLAKALGETKERLLESGRIGRVASFHWGIKKFKELSGLERDEIDILFYLAGLRSKCGHTINPFSTADWNYSIKEMIERLEKVDYRQVVEIYGQYSEYMNDLADSFDGDMDRAINSMEPAEPVVYFLQEFDDKKERKAV